LTLKSINKAKSENKVEIILKNSDTQIRAWQSVESDILKSIICVTFPSLNSKYQLAYEILFDNGNLPEFTRFRSLQSVQTFDPVNYEFIKLTIFYGNPLGDQDFTPVSLNHHVVSVKINPSASNLSSFQSLPASESQFSFVSDNNHMVQFYDSSYYAQGQVIYGISLTISIIFVTMVIFSIVLHFVDTTGNSRKVWISLEGVFTVQLTYFSLMGIGELNPLFVEMAEGLKYSCGYDLTSSGTEKIQIRQLSGIGIESEHLSSNVNVSFLIVLTFVLTGALIYIIKKVRSKFLKNADR
jgi:hypothetical protein